MFRKTLVWITVGLLAFALWGCSSSRDSDGSKTGTDEGPEYVGINVCVSCHDIKGQEWLYSRHGNVEPEGGPHSPHLPGQSSCAECHNPLNDGDLLQQAFNTHEKRRDVIGCESCHGAGSQHYGLGPLPMPAPGPEVCGQCHNRDDGHAGTDESIYDKYASSRHAESLHGEGSNPCQRCHTNEGALKSNVAGYTGDKDVLGTRDDLGRRAPEAIPEEDVTAVGCATCHDPHEAGQLRQVWSSEGDNDYMWDPNNNGSNRDQFDLCTSCHVLFNDEGTLVGSGSEASGTAPFYHDTAWYRIIGTTHYDNPATGPVSGDDADATIIEGYNIRWNTDNPCFDCHGHEFRTATRPYPEGDDRDAPTIWTDWASSAHAAHLFELKLAAASAAAGGGDPADAPRSTATVDAVMAAGVTNPDDAWLHYNWDRSGRASCQRCHTATGAMNFMNANQTLTDNDDDNDAPYNQNANDFSHLVGWSDNPANGSPQNEMLYCWACHENASDGILRDPGPITEAYDDDVVVEYPDIKGSNVCMSCHLGREIGAVIKATEDSDGVRNFINSHYLAAGAQLFAVGGYHYDGLNYNNVSFYAHDKIGTEDEPSTGENGPCAGCHMSTERSHLFQLVEKDSEGAITEVTSQVCAECHTGQFVLTAEELMEQEEEYHASLHALDLALQAKGIFFYPGYPYFFNAPNGEGGSYTNWAAPYGVSKWQETMGAAFNFNLLDHDPGGYAHNRYYVKILIWDSIDFLDDGIVNQSTATTLPTLGLSAEDLAAAQTYLGESRPGESSR
ncbi:MAG: C-type polyheme cytochrome OmcB [Desulfuromonas sp.]|nr:MAG: C-type polyheme cytochrome OmcB [Desulfuromonas sp.]